MDEFDVVQEALTVAENEELKLTAEEEGALGSFLCILEMLPPTVLRGIKRALVEGWIDASVTDKRMKYVSLVTLIKRELADWLKDTSARIDRYSPLLEEYASAIEPFDDPDTSDVCCQLLGTLVEYTSEVHGDVWL